MMALNAPSSSTYIESRMTRSRSRSGNQSGHFLSTAATTAATEDAIIPRLPMLIGPPHCHTFSHLTFMTYFSKECSFKFWFSQSRASIERTTYFGVSLSPWVMVPVCLPSM